MTKKVSTIALIFLVELAIIFVGARIADSNTTQLQQEVRELEYTVTRRENTIKELEEDIVELEDELKSAQDIIDYKDGLLIENGFIPYELHPCYKCGADVVIDKNANGYYYIDCTVCQMFAGFFIDAEDAASHWNEEQ